MRGSLETILRPDPGGIREDVSPALIPEGSYLSSNNWLVRRGRGRPRPGYSLLVQATDLQRLLGLGLRGSKQLGNNLVFFTQQHQYWYDGTSLSDITFGSWITSSTDQLVRSLTFTQGGTDYLLAINQSNRLMEWSGSGTFMQTAGTPPTGRDLFVCGNRLVIVGPSALPYRVQWSEFKDRTVWGSLALTELRDTPGQVVGGAPFSPNSAAIYKDDSVYLATVQAAIEPFQFQFIGLVPGPLSPAVIVNALGVHYWLGEDFSIYKFDGSQPKLVSSGLTKTIASKMNYSDRALSHGFASISQDFREVWFFYPNRGGTFNAISVNIITEAINHHTFGAHTVTAAADWRMGGATIDGLDAFSATIDGLDTVYTTIDGMDGASPVEPVILLGDSTGNVFMFNSAYVTDSGTAIGWSAEDRWVTPGKDQARARLDAVSTLWTATSSSLTVTVDVAATDKLSGTDVGRTATFDTIQDIQHLLTFNSSAATPSQTGKLLRVKYSAASTVAGVEYIGGVLTSWPKGRV